MYHLQQKYSIFLKVQLKMFLSGKKVEGEKSSVKGSSQQSSIPGPKVKGGGPLFSGRGPFIMRVGLVNDTTPVLKNIFSNIIFCNTLPNFLQTLQNIITTVIYEKSSQKILIVSHLSESSDVPEECY